MLNLRFGTYDIWLIVAVTLMGMVLAYLHDPRWKALILTLPIPFSLAFLSVGKPMASTNVSGLLVLLIFTHAVRILHKNLRVPILPAILLSAAAYCLISIESAKVMPTTPAMFWGMFVVVMVIGLLFLRFQPAVDEPGYRTPLPVYLKLPLMAAVVVVLVILKLKLQGFMTVFPMVGVIAAYEARRSLWANCRVIPVIMVSMAPMMACMFITQHYFDRPVWQVLAVGWAVLLSIMLPLTRDVWMAPTTPRPLTPEQANAVQ